MSNRVRILWVSFLVTWSLTLLFFGAVRPWAIATTTLAFVALNLAAEILLPDPVRLPRLVRLLVLSLIGIFVIQFLPLGTWLAPYTASLRADHGVQGLAPFTADTFLTLRSFIQFLAYVLSGLLCARLVQSGLTLWTALKGICAVLLAEALYGALALKLGWANIPFYGPRHVLEAMSGTMVNRNTFAALMGMGLAITIGFIYSSIVYRLPEKEDVLGSLLQRRRSRVFLWGMIAVVFAVCSIFSLSRGGILAIGVALVLFPTLLRGRRGLVFSFPLIVVVTSFVVLVNPTHLVQRFSGTDASDVSFDMRVEYWKSTLSAYLHQPILGFGIGTHPQAYHPFQPARVTGQVSHAHNEYINLLFEAGPLLLLALVGGLALWMYKSMRRIENLHGPDRVLTTSIVAGVLIVAVHSLVDFDLRITSVGILFVCLLVLAPQAVSGAPTVSKPWRFALMSVSTVGALLLLTLRLNPAPAVEAAESLIQTDPDRADQLCRDALVLSPYDFGAALWRAQVALTKQDFDLADRRFRIAGNLWPAHPALQQQVGYYFWGRYSDTRDRHHLEDATRAFHNTLEQKPERTTTILEAIWASSDIPIADVASLIPANSVAVTQFSGYLVSRGMWREGMDYFIKGCPMERASIGAFDEMATLLEQAGQWGLEAQLREKRLTIKGDATALAATARAWGRLGEYNLALQRAEQARRAESWVADWPALVAAIAMQRWKQTKAQEDLTRTIEAYAEAIRLAPADSTLRLRRADAYVKMNMIELAISDYRSVLSKQKDHREATILLSRVLVAGNRISEARQVLHDYLLERPTDPEVVQELKKLP